MGSAHHSLVPSEHPILFGFAEEVRAYKLNSNEIALCAMKSERCSDEICFADEIKSVLLPTKSDFITK